MNTFSQLFLPVSAFFVAVLLGFTFVFDREVGAALLMLVILSTATVFLLRRLGVRRREVYFLLVFVVVSHAVFTLFVHYAGFQPFGTGGGDFIRYNMAAQEVAENLRAGTFSLEQARIGNFLELEPEEIWVPHYFPLILGYVYALVTPAMVVGQLFMVWLAALAVLTLYFLTLEVGATRLWAFLVALLGSFYPSFFFLTSYVLKEALIILLALLSLLLLLKLLKRFSWGNYILLFLIAIPLANLRSEIYDIFAVTFFVFWFGVARMEWRRRVLVGVVIFFLYGFAPVVAMKGTQNGYYDYRTFASLNVKTALNLKENAYLQFIPRIADPVKTVQPTMHEQVQREGQQEPLRKVTYEFQRGRTSTVEDLKVGADNPSSFIWNQARAFAFVTLGPFPWQFSESRHAATLVETIPWLFLVPFIIRGIWKKFREDKRTPALALVLFALGMFIVVAFFINNFGITMRIRMPAVFALLPFLPFAFSSSFQGVLNRLSRLLPKRLLALFY
ncbi:MAG: hypothetical protein A3D64_01450 [Candidatus Wildermuthbacteria bacterium RIFCSPHIGHO2_02_FULL_49_9]|uniref:Glycosyltransferase RgtA/B/C/D-like domain-containing protein n=2 Tax=Candidatus Wildermuthiibacteriota TaxID=1817923 RepID=A0A1G2QYQ8_9BACT|nr:MAG: hypothetical protein A2672_03240 [Candidatus Wildermuthbacteria bacterium RIFCSPHIGHO2_01_FULL_49_22b]OHA70662.1 MAG: hypothetical protein A3D64_01450 [Candidatus Wildermuthbacteria bacterium RIFCSPHIGHO2_02_FULL_49_9]